ncbi:MULTISPECIES: hypothetical protein [Lysinibacillus]|uniref:hypothetical protein n=1 Tax=Lysinibacillus TaxID=400634 RepID=UPI000E203893|nr:MULTISPECIES: hypothetical protein [Lysinibacillus]MED3799243.1 hypothetical protein [Lysinibacillus capsici]RDV31565.1 hypothetical protein C7B89_11165 [Lysinibacillus capsici]
MDRLFQWYKYLKYILIPIIILKYFHNGDIPNAHPLIIFEYALLFGVSFLLIILQDFFAIRKKTKFLLRLIILIILLFLFITAIVYQAIMSIIFSILLLCVLGMALYLHRNEEGEQ